MAEIEEKKAADLVLDTENANAGTERGAQVIRDSLQKYGAGRSIVVDKHGNVIAGNKTLEQAVAAGIDNVVVVKTDGSQIVAVQRVDLDLYAEDDKRARELAVGDNMSHELSFLLDPAQIVKDVTDGADLSVFFTASEMDKVFAKVNADAQEVPESKDDRGAELLEKWRVARGQVWEVGQHRIMCGDCTDKDDSARLMDGQQAHLGLTSPPYAVGKDYEKDVSFAQHIKMLEDLADRSLEAIMPGGFFFINFTEIVPQEHAMPLTGSTRHGIYLISNDYWRIFRERAFDLYAQRMWYKPFNRLIQPFWTYKTSKPHQQEFEHIWTWRAPGGGEDQAHNWDVSVYAVWDTRDEDTEDRPLTRHVAAFPTCLPKRAIRAHTEIGAAVWEPFSGSGTTLAVCEQIERICFAMEISPEYVAVSLERFETMGLEPRPLV